LGGTAKTTTGGIESLTPPVSEPCWAQEKIRLKAQDTRQKVENRSDACLRPTLKTEDKRREGSLGMSQFLINFTNLVL
jgi:hypothetical protein